jgi:hypothetical protein
MADVNKTVQISYQANLAAFERALKRIPDITEAQMKQAIGSIEKELKKADRAAGKTSKNFRKQFEKVGTEVGKVAAGIGGAAFAMVAFGQELADLTNELTDTSTKTGIAVDTLAGLRLAAEGSGLAFEQFIGPLQRTQFFVDQINQGNAASIALFERLGVETKNSAGEFKDMDTIFRDILGSVNALESPIEKNAVLMQLFGEQGAMFVQSGFIDNMESFVDLSTEFGVKVGPDAVAQAGEFQRAMAELSLVSKGSLQDIMVMMTGSSGVTQAIDHMTNGIIIFSELAQSAFKLLSIPIENNIHALYALGKALTGDFEGAFQIFTERIDEISHDAVDIFSTFETIDTRVGKLEEKRAASRAQAASTQDEQQNRRKKNGDTESKQLKEQNNLLRVRASLVDGMLSTEQSLRELMLESQADQISDQLKINMELGKRIKNIDKLFNIERQKLVDLQKQLDAGAISEDEYFELRAAHIEDLKMLHVNAEEAKAKATDRAVRQTELRLMERAELESELNQRAESERQDSAAAAMSMIISGTQSATAAIEAVLDEQGIENEKLRMKLFRINQAAAVADIAFSVSKGIAEAAAIAAIRPAFGIAAGAAIAASGAAQTAAVLSQKPPKFDVGGMVGNSDPSAPDQTTARLLSGEAILDRATTARLGEEGLNTLQNGGTPAASVVVIQPFKHFDRFITAANRRGRYGSSRRSIGAY